MTSGPKKWTVSMNEKRRQIAESIIVHRSEASVILHTSNDEVMALAEYAAELMRECDRLRAATAEAAQDRITRAALERARAEITESRAEQLGQRAVACKHWRWMAGMHTLSGQRVLDIPEDGGPGRFQASILSADDSTGARAVCLLSEWGSELPDTVDPSTRGCLLALVREAHDDPHAHVDYSDDTPTEPWWCWAGDSVSRAATETKALVAALEAAP